MKNDQYVVTCLVKNWVKSCDYQIFNIACQVDGHTVKSHDFFSDDDLDAGRIAV